MQDVFAIYGDEIHLGPYRVASLLPNLPASVRDQAEYLVTIDPDAADREADEAYEKGYDECHREIGEAIKRLHQTGVIDDEMREILRAAMP